MLSNMVDKGAAILCSPPHFHFYSLNNAMKVTRASYRIVHFSFFTLLLLLGCKRDEIRTKVSVNSFSMQVNKQVWTPFQAKDDPCTSTYTCQYGHLGETPFYTIYAYRDPNGTANAESENLLRLQVMNVTEPGSYRLDGTYQKDFDSYLIFQTRNSAGNVRRYISDFRRSPVVFYVDDLYVRPGASIPSIRGSFSGVLYNEGNPADSLTIEKGTFNFNYVGVNYNRHCK